MSEHTPGPWSVDKYGDIWSDADKLVARGCSTAGHRKMANARLIAAAPDLLAALEEVFDVWPSKWSTDTYTKVQAAIRAAREVLR